MDKMTVEQLSFMREKGFEKGKPFETPELRASLKREKQRRGFVTETIRAHGDLPLPSAPSSHRSRGSRRDEMDDPDENTIIPADGCFEVTLRFRMNCAATYAMIEEWAWNELCHSGGIDLENPLLANGPDAVSDPILKDLKRRHFQEDYDHQTMPDGSVKFKRKSWLEADGRRTT